MGTAHFWGEAGIVNFILEFLFFEAVLHLLKDRYFDLCLSFYDVVVGYEVSVFVDEETRAESSGAGDLDDRLGVSLGTFFNGCLFEVGHSVELARRLRLHYSGIGFVGINVGWLSRRLL